MSSQLMFVSNLSVSGTNLYMWTNLEAFLYLVFWLEKDKGTVLLAFIWLVSPIGVIVITPLLDADQLEGAFSYPLFFHFFIFISKSVLISN